MTIQNVKLLNVIKRSASDEVIFGLMRLTRDCPAPFGRSQ